MCYEMILGPVLKKGPLLFRVLFFAKVCAKRGAV